MQTSPGAQQMFTAFESLLANPSCSSKMAELARALGEKRMCKLEVDMETLPVDIYCLEQEALQSALQPLRSIVSCVCVVCVCACTCVCVCVCVCVSPPVSPHF